MRICDGKLVGSRSARYGFGFRDVSSQESGTLSFFLAFTQAVPFTFAKSPYINIGVNKCYQKLGGCEPCPMPPWEF